MLVSNFSKYISPEAGARRRSVEKVLLKNSQNSKESNCAGMSYFNKVAGLRPASLLKKRLCAQVFSCKFCEIFKSVFFIEHLW